MGLAQSMRTVEEPEGIAPLELQFPISRRFGTGTTGSIEVKIKIRQQITGRNVNSILQVNLDNEHRLQMFFFN